MVNASMKPDDDLHNLEFLLQFRVEVFDQCLYCRSCHIGCFFNLTLPNGEGYAIRYSRPIINLKL